MLPTAAAETVGSVMSRIILLPIFFATLWIIPRRTYKWVNLPNCFFLVTLAYLLTAGYYMPWYFLWILPLIPLRAWDRLSRYTLAFGTATIFLGSDLHAY